MRRVPGGGCGCDGAVGAGRNSNRRSKTNEKERICIFISVFFTSSYVWNMDVPPPCPL